VPTVSAVDIDGVFGSGTRQQVINFQRYYNLTPDGIVGSATWEKMYRLYQSIRDGVSTPEETPPAGRTYPGVPLRRGSSGSNVVQIPQWLAALAQVYSEIPTLAVDGRFGAGTERSVRAFQTKFSLASDGIVGRQTWNRLYSVWQDRVAEGLL